VAQRGLESRVFPYELGRASEDHQRRRRRPNFDPYCVTAPSDPRLPGGGGYQTCGLYDIAPTSFGQSSLVVSRDTSGDEREIYNGVDVAIDVRLPKGINLNGGVNAGRTEMDFCGAVVNNPQIAFSNLTTADASRVTTLTLTGAPAGSSAPRLNAYCDVVPPWSADTQFKVSGTIPLPYHFYTGLTYQNLPGIPYYASAVFNNAAIAPSLGRNLAAGATATATVDLIAPMTQFEDRIQQFDLRFARNFRFGGKNVEPEFDIYNALNASPVLSVNNNYGPSWRTPIQILSGRLLKFGLKVTF